MRGATARGSGKEHVTAIGTIEVDRHDGVCVLALQGEHDVSTTPSLRDELERAYGSVPTVVVDFSEVEFIDSSVLQGVLYGRDVTEHATERRLVLVVPQGGIARRLLSLASLDDLIPTYPSRAEALTALTSEG